jgi:lysosomal acid lipase/cholesteryl ester hydrolase
VTTEDGYILTMHRIPYSPKSPAAPNKSVVFLQHGLLGSSADWIILGPKKSLGEFQCHFYELLKLYLY